MALNHLQTAQQKDELCTGAGPGAALGSACRVCVSVCLCILRAHGGLQGCVHKGPRRYRSATDAPSNPTLFISLWSPSPSPAPSPPLFLLGLSATRGQVCAPKVTDSRCKEESVCLVGGALSAFLSVKWSQ